MQICSFCLFFHIRPHVSAFEGAHLCGPIWTPCNFNILIISLESVEWSVNQTQKCRETAPSQVSLQCGKLETPALAWQGNVCLSPKCWDATGEFGGDCQTLDMLIKELLADGFAEERSSGWLSPVAKMHSNAHNLASQKPQPLTELSPFQQASFSVFFVKSISSTWIIFVLTMTHVSCDYISWTQATNWSMLTQVTTQNKVFVQLFAH